MHYGISSMATYLVALSLRADLSDAKVWNYILFNP